MTRTEHRPGTLALLGASTGDTVADDALRTTWPLVAVTLLHADGWSVGLLNALPFLWFLIGARGVGTLVDRGPRRAALVGLLLRRGGVSAALALLHASMLGMPTMMLLVVSIGLGDALFTTGHGVLVPATVGPERTGWLYQRLEALGSIARLTTPALVA